MNKKLKKKWVEALRSGDYEQGKSTLCRLTPTGAVYCCLGVLAEVVEGEDTWNKLMKTSLLVTKTGYSQVYGHKYLDVQERAKLMNMNDGGQHSFNSIADWIEENL